jgi:uncharacterized membrane protein
VYELIVSLHVAAAVVGFGATFTYPLIQRAGGATGAQGQAQALTTVLVISRRLAVPAALVVGATGAYQVIDGRYSFADWWLVSGTVLYVAVMLVATVLVAPAYERARQAAREMLEQGGLPSESAEYRGAMRLIDSLGPLLAVAILAVVYLMVAKPA